MDAINQNLRDTPRPEDANTLLAKMQAALGKGVAPPIPDVPNTVEEEGYWEGGYYLASEWAEAFLLQYGAGLEVGYGQVSVPEDIYDYMRLHTYYRAVNDRPYLIEQRGQSDLLAHMLWDLQGPPTGEGRGEGKDNESDGGVSAAVYLVPSCTLWCVFSHPPVSQTERARVPTTMA